MEFYNTATGLHAGNSIFMSFIQLRNFCNRESEGRLLRVGPQSQTTIHDKVGSCYKGRIFRDQKQGGIADVGGHSPTPERMESRGLLGHSLSVFAVAQILIPQARVNISGADTVHANAAGRKFKSEITGQGN